MKEQLCISFSGGRTSAYMTKIILDNWSEKYDIQVIFANTGLEHEKTLEFVNNCDKNMGFNTKWVECVVKDFCFNENSFMFDLFKYFLIKLFEFLI